MRASWPSVRSLSSFTAATAPLFPAAVGLTLGAIADRQFHVSTPIALAGFAFFGLPLFVPRFLKSAGFILLLLAGLFFGAANHAMRTRTTIPNSVERYATTDGTIVRLIGVVESEPQLMPRQRNMFARWTYGRDRTGFLLDVGQVASVNRAEPVAGRIRVTGEVLNDIVAGDRVEAFGRLVLLAPPANPGSFDWAEFYRNQGIVARMYMDHRESVRLVKRQSASGFASLQSSVRSRLRGWLTSDLVSSTESDIGVIEAMVLGHRTQLDRKLNSIFSRAGCLHYLAASGSNVAIVSFVVAIPLFLLGIARKKRALILLLALILYAIGSDPRPPILRATVIGVIFCLSMYAGRSRARLNWISCSAIVLFLIDPAVVFDVGYQLSMAAVIGVCFLSPAIIDVGQSAFRTVRRLVNPQVDFDLLDKLVRTAGSDAAKLSLLRTATRRIGLVLRDYGAMSLAAWATGLPIGMCVFHQLQPWGPIVSTVVFPLVSLVTGIGFAKVILAPLSPTLNGVLAVALESLNDWLIRVVDLAASLPKASIVATTPPWWVIAIYYGFLLALVVRWRASRHYQQLKAVTDEGNLPRESKSIGNSVQSDDPPIPPYQGGNEGGGSIEDGAACDVRSNHVRDIDVARLRVRRMNIAAAAMVAFLCLSLIVWSAARFQPHRLTATVLAVGRGSATILQLPDGETIVFDAGSPGPYDVAESTLLPFLASTGIDEIDRIYVSHPNLDHFSGVPGILSAIQSGPVVVNEHFAPHARRDSPAEYFLEWLNDNNHRVEVISTDRTKWSFGGADFELLWPPPNLPESVRANDTSLVIRVSYAGHSILLTGDIEEYPQSELIKSTDLQSDVLLLPHHGSIRPSTDDFIHAVAPKYAIRSTSDRGDERRAAFVQSLGSAPLLTTAIHGAVTITIDDDGLTVKPTFPDNNVP